jgi:hypothetical protein
MRDFTKVSPTLWRSCRFADLQSDDGKFLFLYLLTCAHQNSAGCFWLPDGYACNDLRWDVKRYRSASQVLIDAGFIQFDKINQVVLIERWFKHIPPMNRSHVKSNEAALEQCPSTVLRDRRGR